MRSYRERCTPMIFRCNEIHFYGKMEVELYSDYMANWLDRTTKNNLPLSQPAGTTKSITEPLSVLGLGQESQRTCQISGFHQNQDKSSVLTQNQRWVINTRKSKLVLLELCSKHCNSETEVYDFLTTNIYKESRKFLF